MRRLCLLLLLSGLAAVPTARRSWGQPVQGPPAQRLPPALDVTGLPLAEALGRAAAYVGVGLSYDAALLPPRTATCRTSQREPAAVFACVLAGTGLRAIALAGRLYTLGVAPLPRPSGTLRGFVSDASSGLPLADASVFVVNTDARGGRSASTNERGLFTLTGLPAGPHRLRVSFVGYAPAAVLVDLDSGRVTDVVVRLAVRPIVVQPVVIDGIQNRRLSEGEEEGRRRDPETATDVAARLSGVTGVHPGNIVADVHLQGGDSGEHLLLLDGAPVFTPPVVGGLVGAFSPFAIGRLSVQKAGFGAATGSNTVGIVEASHTLPVEDGTRVTAQADVLALHGRLALGGQDARGTRLRAMGAVRSGLGAVLPPPGLATQLRDWNRTDPFLAAVTADGPGGAGDPVAPFLRPLVGGEDPSWRFYDGHLATEFARPDGVRYGVSGYVGARRLDAALPLVSDDPIRLRDRYTWKSAMLQGRRASFVGRGALLDVQAYHSQYRLRHSFSLPDSLRGTRPGAPDDDGNAFQETALSASLLATPSPRLRLDAGVAPAFVVTRLSILNARRQPLRHASWRLRLPAFANARLRVNPAVEVEGGVRLTTFADDLTLYAEPRVAARLDLARTPVGAFSARVGAGLYQQFVQQLAVSSISPSSLVSSTRVWMGVDRSVRPPIATHISAESALRPGAGVEVRAEGYFKRQFRLHQVDFAADVPVGTGPVPQSQMLLYARGYASGVVVSTEQTLDRLSWRLRYEYGLVERQTSLFSSNFYPVPWNEPHHVEATLTVRPAPGWTVLARASGIWGRAWGFRRAYYDYVGAYGALVRPTSPQILAFVERTLDAYNLREPVEQTLPPWQQLDLSGAYTAAVGATRVSLRVDLLNATNRRNVQEYRLIGDPVYYQQTGVLRRDARYGLPITAVVALQVAW